MNSVVFGKKHSYIFATTGLRSKASKSLSPQESRAIINTLSETSPMYYSGLYLSIFRLQISVVPALYLTEKEKLSCLYLTHWETPKNSKKLPKEFLSTWAYSADSKTIFYRFLQVRTRKNSEFKRWAIINIIQWVCATWTSHNTMIANSSDPTYREIIQTEKELQLDLFGSENSLSLSSIECD